MTVNSYIAKGKQEFRHLLFRVCASWRPLVATLFFFVLLAAAIYSLGAGWMPAAVALSFAATWLLYYLIDRHSDYVNDRIVSLVLAFVVVVLLVIAPVWWLVNVRWAGQDARRETAQTHFEAGGTGYVARLDYPHTSLQGQTSPLTMTVALSPTMSATSAYTLTVGIAPPRGLRVVDAAGVDRQAVTVQVDSAGAGQPEGGLMLLNDGMTDGLRESGTLTLSLRDTISPTVMLAELPAPIVMEGDRGFELRRFVNSTIDEASPLVWVALLLLPAVAVLAQRLVDDRKRRRAEEIDLGWTRFQEYFMSEGAPAPGSPSGKEKAAQHELAVLKTLERREPMAGRYVDVGQAFLDFADGYGHLAPPPSTATEQRPTEEDRRVLEMNGRWPELFAGAYLHLHRGIHLYYEKHQRGPEKALLEHYSDARLRLQYAALEARPDVRDQLAVAFAVDSKRLAYPIQALVWPQPRVDEPDGRRFGPFRQGDATDPGEALFLRGGFYGRHPLFNRDLRPLGRPTTDSHLVTGSSGCGRSAFAAALTGRPHADEITVGLRGRPNPRDMWVGVARQLTDFVLTHPTHAHPTHLEKMGRARITALAALLIETRGYATAAATVEHVQANLDNLHGLGTFDRRGKAGLLLQLLARALADEEARRDRAAAVPAHDRWGRDGPDGYLLECLAALGFNRVTFVLDLPLSGGVGGWVSSHVFDRLEEWRGASARFIIFAPQAIAADVARPPSLIRKHKLSWTEKQLREMIDTRYAYALGRYRHAAERFADSAGLTTLIEHSKVGTDDNSYNPRRFIRLWQAATKELGADDPISQAHIAAAVREVKG